MSGGAIDGLAVDDIRRQTPGLQPAALHEEAGKAASFGDLVSNLIEGVNAAQVHAEQASVGLAKGETDIVDTVLAIDKASLSLKFMVEMRNKALDAYEKVMRSL